MQLRCHLPSRHLHDHPVMFCRRLFTVQRLLGLVDLVQAGLRCTLHHMSCELLLLHRRIEPSLY